MKNKKFLLFIIAIILCVIAAFTVTKFTKKEEDKSATEITPVEEMTEEQERQTMIALYYTNIETNTLIPEARVIDVKDLLENPYKTLVEYLISGPNNEKFKSSLPNGTKVNNATLVGDVAVIDLSKEFIEGQDENTIKLGIDSIVNTLTELNEVGAIKIQIDGEENMNVDGTNINLSENFRRAST